jgi:trk system potassium uptake protein TrkH
MLVKDAMNKEVKSVNKERTVLEAARLMAQNDIGCLVVTHEKRAVGIITHGDIIKRLIVTEHQADATKVKDIMTTPLVTVFPLFDLKEAANILNDKGIKKLVVVDSNNKLIGILTATDIIRKVHNIGSEPVYVYTDPKKW